VPGKSGASVGPHDDGGSPAAEDSEGVEGAEAAVVEEEEGQGEGVWPHGPDPRWYSPSHVLSWSTLDPHAAPWSPPAVPTDALPRPWFVCGDFSAAEEGEDPEGPGHGEGEGEGEEASCPEAGYGERPGGGRGRPWVCWIMRSPRPHLALFLDPRAQTVLSVCGYATRGGPLLRC